MMAPAALTAGRVAALLARFRSLRVWVVGDVMLDDYIEGVIDRISPEAPVQVVNVSGGFQRIGGAANVAHGITALGAQATVCGVVGDDEAGKLLTRAITTAGVEAAGLIVDTNRPTTRKLRVLARHQQVLRLDWETTVPLTADTADSLLARTHALPRPDAIVLSDYAKGVLTPQVIAAVIGWGQRHDVPVLVDPKSRDFSRYRGATVITPNLKEVEAAVGETVRGDDDASVGVAARRLIATADARAIVVTRGEHGMTVVERDGGVTAIPAMSREVYDVTGAGDTAIATLALGLAAGCALPEAAHLASLAAGVAVGKVGAAVVTAEELAGAAMPHIADKVVSAVALAERRELWRIQKRQVVFTNGCYDLLHVGHVSLLQAAARLGDVLVIGINTDASVQRLKGAERPLIPQDERAALLAALDCVDAVTTFDEDTPIELIELLRPDILVKGADYRLDQVVGREIVEAYGGHVALVPLVKGRSTSILMERIRKGT